MTQCNHGAMKFASCRRRRVRVDFSGGSISSNGGALLLREVDRKLGLTAQVARALGDQRQRAKVRHEVVTMVRQRVHAVAAGYEDLNDHDALRHDEVVQTACERDESLASSSTLCRFERRAERQWAVAIHQVLVEQFIASHRRAPRELVIDFDATDDPVHGHQHGRFFHGYYDRYCFLPLYAFCGRQLLVAYLRPSNIDAARHTWAILSLLVKRLRQAWPGVRIVLRGDSAFCRHRMLDWCERHRVGYIVGLARNAVLERKVEVACEGAERGFQATGRKCRVFTEVQYGAGTWRRPRRVIAARTQGAEPALHRDQPRRSGEGPLRAGVLPARRDGEPHQGAAARPVRRPHLEPAVVDESISGGARGPGLHPARDDAPHCTAGHGPCPSAMPNPATTASEARRGGDPKHPHRRGAAVEHLPRPSVVPAPGAPAHCRIARGERAVAERGFPGSPRTGALRPRTPPRLENALPRPSPSLRSALPGHLRPIPVPNMRRKMPHYVQTTPNSPFVQYPG